MIYVGIKKCDIWDWLGSVGRVFTPAGCDLFDQVASPVTRVGGASNGEGEADHWV